MEVLKGSAVSRPAVVVGVGLVLVGGATGSLIGPAGVVVIALFGLAWAALLALAVGWLGRQQRSRRTWAKAIILACFVPIGLLAGSLPDDKAFGWICTGAIVVLGVVVTFVAVRLSRQWPTRQAWGRATLAVGVIVGGMMSGSALTAELLFGATLADAPEVFGELVRGYVGDAQAMPYYLLNTPMEWLLMPLIVLLNWPERRQRRLVLTAIVIYVSSRVWTYLYFVPQIGDWESAAALSPEQLDQARWWTGLSWIRFAVDFTMTILLLLAALATRGPARTERHITEQSHDEISTADRVVGSV